MFVPVQYIERIFNATYSEEGFTLNGDASNTMTVFEDKEDSGDSAIGKRLTVEETEGEKEVSQKYRSRLKNHQRLNQIRIRRKSHPLLRR